MKGKQVTIQIRLNAELGERLEEVRMHREMSRASLLKLALVDFLDRLEAEGRT